MQARRFAAQQGTTLRSLIEQGLRQVLAEKPEATEFRLRRVTFKGRGLQAEMRSVGWDRLRETAYEGHGG